MVVLVGLPGAGKSWLAAQLQAADPAHTSVVCQAGGAVYIYIENNESDPHWSIRAQLINHYSPNHRLWFFFYPFDIRSVESLFAMPLLRGRARGPEGVRGRGEGRVERPGQPDPGRGGPVQL